jgi:2-phosphoglycerate kinase
MHNLHRLKQELAHVLWMGGSPCSGKSSIANIVAEQCQLQIYHVDEAFNMQHRSRIIPAEHPMLHRWTTTPWNELWTQPADILLAETKACYHEHFDLIVEDLLSLSKSVPILAEGTALLPDRVFILIEHRHQALWTVPTQEFQRNHYPHRGAWVQQILSQCEHPDQALRNWMDRDVALAQWTVQRTKSLGLPLLEVDGTRSIAGNAEWVMKHFHLS